MQESDLRLLRGIFAALDFTCETISSVTIKRVPYNHPMFLRPEETLTDHTCFPEHPSRCLLRYHTPYFLSRQPFGTRPGRAVGVMFQDTGG
jgi:hypothetical protein